MRTEKVGIILTEGGYKYLVPWDRLVTAADVLGWAAHLMEKRWFTKLMCDRFIEIACAHRKIKYRPI
jgi:hypothetical protein